MKKITDLINDEELVVNGETIGDCQNDCKHKSSWVLPGMKDLGCGVSWDAFLSPNK